MSIWCLMLNTAYHGIIVPSYQPETAYKIFMRAMFNRDIATGTIDLSDNLTTTGPSSTWHIRNDVLPAPKPICYILMPNSCTDDQLATLKNNTAIIKNYVVVGHVGGESSEDPLGSSFAFRYSEDGYKQQVLRNMGET